MQNKQQKLKILLQENQFIFPSYQHYGGFSGYQDYGILGTRIKQKFLEMWRDFFVRNDNIEELESPIIVPFSILKASGHVDRFTDFVVYDKNQNCFRADHLAKKWFRENNLKEMEDEVDTWNVQELEENINKYNMVDVEGRIKVERKNLMFEVPSINGDTDFLRPELAPTLFVNFKICQLFLKTETSFGLAQVGSSFRKEISPNQFVRMRQFNQNEIEYFCDPQNKDHPQYEKYKTTIVPILTQDMQNSGNMIPLKKISIDEAVNSKLINHKLMGYFLSKIYLFALKVGLKEDKLRFRQHLKHEMAHYAISCWDLETFVNDSWLECVGCADRGSYDLEAHSINKRNKLTTKRKIDPPITKTELKIILNLRVLAKEYKEKTPKIEEYFCGLTTEEKNDLFKTINNGSSIKIIIDHSEITLTKEMIQVKEEKNVYDSEEYFPHVIEPSFGVDRIIYSIFEQNFWSRQEDINRTVVSLPYCLAPYHVAIFKLSKDDELNKIANGIYELLRNNNLQLFIDNSCTNIGKKYVRSDEMGVKYAITIDFDTLTDNQVTIRERDSMSQIRVPINELLINLKNLNLS